MELAHILLLTLGTIAVLDIARSLLYRPAKGHKENRMDTEGYEVRTTAVGDAVGRLSRLLVLFIGAVAALTVAFVILIYVPIASVRADVGKEEFYDKVVPAVGFYATAIFWLVIFGSVIGIAGWFFRRAQTSDNATVHKAGEGKAMYDAFKAIAQNEGKQLAMQQYLMRQSNSQPQTAADDDAWWVMPDTSAPQPGYAVPGLPDYGQPRQGNGRMIGMNLDDYGAD